MFALSVISFIALATAAYGQIDGYIVFDNKTQCINAMVEWCDNMKYPQEGAGMSMISVSYTDPKGVLNRVFCSSDYDGTNCTRNGSPWFYCSPDNKLSYKGKLLTKDSTDVDDDICDTADRAMNDLSIPNLSYDNTTLKKEMEKGMESFFQQMSAMQEQIIGIQNMLKNFRMFQDPFFGAGFPFVRNDWGTDSPVTQLNTDASNQIERERE